MGLHSQYRLLPQYQSQLCQHSLPNFADEYELQVLLESLEHLVVPDRYLLMQLAGPLSVILSHSNC